MTSNLYNSLHSNIDSFVTNSVEVMKENMNSYIHEKLDAYDNYEKHMSILKTMPIIANTEKEKNQLKQQCELFKNTIIILVGFNVIL